MCMSHDLHWLELCHTIWKSRPAPLHVWVTNYVYESRPILTRFMSHNMNELPFSPPHMSHELRTWVTNYIAWVTSHNLYKSPGPPPHLSHELCIYVTNYNCSSWVTSNEADTLLPSTFESRTMYMRHEVKWFRVMSHNMYESPCLPSDVSHERCIWVTSYAYESQSTVIWSYVTQYVWVTLSPSWCESRTVYPSHALCTGVTIYIGSSIWVTNSCESRTMFMSHELHWLETRTIALHHASPAMFPGFWVTNYIYESRTLYISHELCWYGLRHTKCMSRPAPLLIWVMNYVHESRTILAQDKSKCAPTRSASNVSWFSSHELGIWVTN